MFGLVDYASSDEEEETLPLPTQPSDEEKSEVQKKPSPEQEQIATPSPTSLSASAAEESRFEEFQIKTPKSMSDFHAFVHKYQLDQYGSNFSSMLKPSPIQAQNNKEQTIVETSSSERSSGRRSKWDMTSN